MFDPVKLKNFSTQSGVYLMKDVKGRVLYVGKAKNIQARVKQYFGASRDERPLIPYLMEKVHDIETIIALSEKEALLLEDTLIKKYKPKYNILLKDDKSYVSLKITKHKWPMVQLVRYKGKPPQDGLYFGPYTNAYEARRILDLLNRFFPLRQCSDRELATRLRPCILYQMKRCIAPCQNLCTEQEYNQLVKRTAQFLKGKDKELIKGLYADMEAYAEDLQFERAQLILSNIKKIEHALQEQMVFDPHRIDLDALGIYRQGDELTLSQLFFREGKLIGVENFHFSETVQDDDEIITSFLMQHYEGKEYIPYEILLPQDLVEVEALNELLEQGKSHKISIKHPQKGEKTAFLEMAYENAKASFHKEKDKKTIIQRTLLDLQEKLHLQNFPSIIDCFDTSHLSGTEAVSTAVRYIEGQKAPSSYKKFILKSTKASDDFGALYEVLSRRYRKAKEDNDIPNLIVIDGGKGQLNVAKAVLDELNIATVDLISLAKEEGRHDKGIAEERVFLPNQKNPILLNTHSASLFLLQQIRDEAHRFVIEFHRKKRSKRVLKNSLNDIKGIGPIKQKRLLQTFGSIKQISLADDEAILKVKSINQKDLVSIRNFFNSNT